MGGRYAVLTDVNGGSEPLIFVPRVAHRAITKVSRPIQLLSADSEQPGVGLCGIRQLLADVA